MDKFSDFKEILKDVSLNFNKYLRGELELIEQRITSDTDIESYFK